MIRRTVTWLAIGIAIGVIASMWYGPNFIRWWWQAPGQPAAYSCDPQIKTATEWLVRVQLLSGGLLGILMAIVANLIAKKRPPKAAAELEPTK